MAIRFLTFELDPDRRELRNQGTLVPLAPKPFDVLCYLIAHRNRMVTKSELLDAFWSVQVSEAALQTAISLLRKVINCDRQSIIRTYHGLGFRFVPEVLTQPQDSQSQSEDRAMLLHERRLVGVLCLRFDPDMDRNSTLVATFLKQASESVQTHQGEALRMTVDGFTAAFGLTTHYEDAARRAVYCGIALGNLAQNLDGISPIIAIDHGPVDLAAQAHNDEWLQPSKIERRAVELAHHGTSHDILLSAATEYQLRDEVVCKATHGGFRLITADDMQAGVPARPRKTVSEFVGRSAELAFLQKSLENLDAGNGQAIVLSGPAGIGKTRLLGEFLAGLDSQQYRPLKLQCLPRLSNSPLAPIRDMCLALFANAPTGTLQSEIDDALHAELLDDATPLASGLDELSEHQRKQQSYGLIIRMLAAYCAQRPLVLAVEDVHWLDLTSRDCLDAIIRAVDKMALLIVMTSRPSDTPTLSEMVIQLSPLGHRDGLKLLHDNASHTRLDDLMADDLVRRAAGNPFFIEELALASQSGRDPSRALPDTVHAVISVRIDALDPTARMFLYVIAVIGPPAPVDLVAHLLNQSAQTANATAERLGAMGFVQTDPSGFSFRHMLISDTAYTMLAPAERQRLHREIAAYLDSDMPDWSPRPETLAWHYQEAGQHNEASQYWLKASRAALRRFAHREGIIFAQNGLALLTVGPAGHADRELDLQICLASGFAAIKGYAAQDTGAAYSRALEMNQSVANPRANIRILVGLWIHTWVSGRLSRSLGFAQDLLAVATGMKDPALSLQAHASIGQVLFHKGDMAGALPHLTVGLEAISNNPPTTAPSQSAAVACSAFACWTQVLTGNETEAKRVLEISKGFAHLHKNPLSEAIHYGLCSAPLMAMNSVEHCLEYGDRSISVSRNHDFAFWLGNGLIIRGWALGQQGDLQAAFEALEEGFDVIKTTGAGVQLANWCGLKAETELMAGKFKEGLRTAEYALECAAKTQDRYFVPRIHAISARLWHELGDADRSSHHAGLASITAADFGMADKVITLWI